MNNSWVKLHRKFLISPVWQYASNMQTPSLIRLWLYLLLSANWEEKKWYDGKKENIIPPGSLITSRKHLAEGAIISEQQVRTGLKHLENMQMITRRITNKWTQVWIVNWSKYQMQDNSNNQQENQQITNKEPTDNQQITTTKEYKNIRNKEEREKTPSKFFLLNIPEIELEELAQQFSCTQSQIISKAASLYDYCQSKGKVYKDYRAFLRNALRKDFGNRSTTAAFNPDLPQEISEEGLAKLREMKKKVLGNKFGAN